MTSNGHPPHDTSMKAFPPPGRPSRLPSQTPTSYGATQAPTGEPTPRTDRDLHEQDERLKRALGWDEFETWCTSNGLRGLRSPPATPEAVALVARYITYLVATGRNVTTAARLLLRNREPKA
jgi:hypothetical protein